MKRKRHLHDCFVCLKFETFGLSKNRSLVCTTRLETHDVLVKMIIVMQHNSVFERPARARRYSVRGIQSWYVSQARYHCQDRQVLALIF